MDTQERERLHNRSGYATLSSKHKNFFVSTRLSQPGHFFANTPLHHAGKCAIIKVCILSIREVVS